MNEKNNNVLIGVAIGMGALLIAMICFIFGYMFISRGSKIATKPTPAPVVSAAPADTAASVATPPPAAPAAPAVEQTMYVVNVQNAVYLRSEPSENSSHITTINLGNAVTAIGGDTGGFTRVRYGGMEGYIKSQYLTTDSGVASSQVAARIPQGSSDTVVKSTMYVNNVQNSIYLRSGPSENASIITTIPLGTAVGYITTVDGFDKISYNGTLGYAKTQYITAYRPYSGGSSYSGGTTMTVVGVAHSIYLRETPSSNSRNITEIPVGATVTYLGDAGNGFYRIRYNGMEGYGTAQYLR